MTNPRIALSHREATSRRAFVSPSRPGGDRHVGPREEGPCGEEPAEAVAGVPSASKTAATIRIPEPSPAPAAAEASAAPDRAATRSRRRRRAAEPRAGPRREGGPRGRTRGRRRPGAPRSRTGRRDCPDGRPRARRREDGPERHPECRAPGGPGGHTREDRDRTVGAHTGGLSAWATTASSTTSRKRSPSFLTSGCENGSNSNRLMTRPQTALSARAPIRRRAPLPRRSCAPPPR